jgi:flavin reductase (DIM6/NTAB) family NADH-FMN oxidoreductase RutF
VSFERPLLRAAEAGEHATLATLVPGEIVRFRVRDDLLLKDGPVDAGKPRAVGRMGSHGYARTRDLFTLERPKA